MAAAARNRGGRARHARLAACRAPCPAAHASPAVLTIALPPALDSNRVGAELRAAGYLLSYQSRYLLERNWLQICLMGEWEREQIAPLLALLRAATAAR